MPAKLAGKYESEKKKIAEIKKIPLLKGAELLELASRIRPLYKFNDEVLYWLVPAGKIFPDSFGSKPIMGNGCLPFIGIPQNSLREVWTLRCYSVEPWRKLSFNVAEVLRQMPSELVGYGAFRLLSDSFYDAVLKLYYVPIVFYRIDCEIPQEIMQIDPLPAKTDWQPLK